MIRFDLDEHLTEQGWGVDLTPMIDMVFLLLVFFLLTSVFSLPVVDVSPPAAESPASRRLPPATVTVRRDGALSLNGRSVSEAGLGRELGRLLAGSPDRRVLIQADRRVSFGAVVRVMEISREAGAGDVSFLVEPAEQ